MLNARGVTLAGGDYEESHCHDKRADMVVATIKGKVVSWENNWFGSSGESLQTMKSTLKDFPTSAESWTRTGPSQSEATERPDDWRRVAYYSAQRGLTDNVMFMGNYGGQGSGYFDK